MIRKSILPIILLFALFSCDGGKKPIDCEHYIIDLDGKKDPYIPVSTLFKDIRTIILETNKDCLIGHINCLQVFDENIYILDSNKAKSLFVFDMEGRFIRKIGGIGRGPGEYVGINDFTFDRENRIIFIDDYENRIQKYKLDGTYLQTITVLADNSFTNFIQFYDNRLFSSQLLWDKSNDNPTLLEIDPNDGKIISQSIPLKYNKGWNENFIDHTQFFMSRANDPPRYNLMFMDYIVSLGKEITPYIELKSKYLTTEADIETFRGKDEIPINLLNIMNSSKLFNVNSFIENNDFICFRIGFLKTVVVFYKKTGYLNLANNLSNDLIYKHDAKDKFCRFLYADENGAYSILDTQWEDLDEFKRAIKNNETVAGLDKEDQLMKITEESNPVIFYYGFKDAD